jgi:hypothetical protein
VKSVRLALLLTLLLSLTACPDGVQQPPVPTPIPEETPPTPTVTPTPEPISEPTPEPTPTPIAAPVFREDQDSALTALFSTNVTASFYRLEFGPGSKGLEERFGPGSKGLENIKQLFGPGSKGLEELKTRFGPGSKGFENLRFSIKFSDLLVRPDISSFTTQQTRTQVERLRVELVYENLLYATATVLPSAASVSFATTVLPGRYSISVFAEGNFPPLQVSWQQLEVLPDYTAELRVALVANSTRPEDLDVEVLTRNRLVKTENN